MQQWEKRTDFNRQWNWDSILKWWNSRSDKRKPHTTLCTRWGRIQYDENPWMNYIIYSSIRTTNTHGYYAISFNFNSFAIVYSSLTHRVICASTVEQSGFFFWKLKPVFDRFLVGCCCYCYFIIIVIMNEWCILSIVYIFGATERDTVQHFHWWVLNVETILPIVRSISHFIHIFLTVFSLIFLPLDAKE